MGEGVESALGVAPVKLFCELSVFAVAGVVVGCCLDEFDAPGCSVATTAGLDELDETLCQDATA